MKRVITITGILLVIVAFSLWGIVYVRDIRDSVIVQCEQMLQLDGQALTDYVDDATNTWQNHVSVLGCFIYHDELDAITDQYHLLQASLKSGDQTTFEQSVYLLQSLLERLYQKQLPLPENIL